MPKLGNPAPLAVVDPQNKNWPLSPGGAPLEFPIGKYALLATTTFN